MREKDLCDCRMRAMHCTPITGRDQWLLILDNRGGDVKLRPHVLWGAERVF